MKTTELNTIKNNQAAELKAKELKEKAAKEAAELEKVAPGTINDMIEDLESGLVTIVTDEYDNIIGIGSHPHTTGIKVVKKIGCALTIGSTEEERKVDEFDLKIFQKKYGANAMRYLQVALKIKESGLKPSKIIESGSRVYLILADQKKVIDDNGHTIVDLSKEWEEEVPEKLMVRLLENELASKR